MIGAWIELFETPTVPRWTPTHAFVDPSADAAHHPASSSKKGRQANGRSRGGRTTKIHALTDAQRRRVALVLTGRQAANCTAGTDPLARMPACEIPHGDEEYDSTALRRQIENGAAKPNILPKANWEWKNCRSQFLYRNRNAIEHMSCRLKAIRRVATRYDRSAANFLSAVGIASTGSHWL